MMTDADCVVTPPGEPPQTAEEVLLARYTSAGLVRPGQEMATAAAASTTDRKGSPPSPGARGERSPASPGGRKGKGKGGKGKTFSH